MSVSFTRRTALKGAAGAIALTGAGGAELAAAAPATARTLASPAAAGLLAAAGRKAPGNRRFEGKISALLKQMTVEEKLGQLQMRGGWEAGMDAEARAGRLGAILGSDSAAAINTLQRAALESRLGIPLIFGLDVIHGFLTTFPIPLAQGSSFDTRVALTDATVGAREAAASGIRWTFAPMVDVSHEPRWGRIAECYGEDPYMNAVFGVAKVRGYQGDDYGAPDRLAACAKHYAAYGQPEGGRDYNTVDVSEQRLRNMYLPSYMACVYAGCATVMAAFNTISGVPAHANVHTLTEILKQEWGFDGFVVSDYTGVQELIPHGIAADGKDAARLSLNAGVDQEMVSTNFLTYGAELLAEGKLSMERLDDAVRRILRVKFAAGLFDRPLVDESAELTAPSAADRARARNVAARSMVLLRNEGGALPLAKTVSSIAVVGPLGNDTQNLHGSWATVKGSQIPAVSIVDGIKAAVPGANVTFTAGSTVTGDDTSGFGAAQDAARAADVTVVVVGETADLSGEASSRSDIGLPGVQAGLVRAIAETGRPFVVVLINGRPLTIADWHELAPAILEAWDPGIEGGNAVADVLFGAVNPGGKLPVSFPRTVGQIPIYYNHENTGRPFDPNSKWTSKYLDLPNGPLYEFGFGLSYTTFTVSAPTLSTSSLSASALQGGARVQVSVQVTNTGSQAGDEVVQIYVHDPVASIVQPVKRLRAFRRVTLAAGASTTVRFRLGAEDLGYWTNDYGGEFVLEPGEFHIYAGNTSSTESVATLTVT